MVELTKLRIPTHTHTTEKLILIFTLSQYLRILKRRLIEPHKCVIILYLYSFSSYLVRACVRIHWLYLFLSLTFSFPFISCSFYLFCFVYLSLPLISTWTLPTQLNSVRAGSLAYFCVCMPVFNTHFTTNWQTSFYFLFNQFVNAKNQFNKILLIILIIKVIILRIIPDYDYHNNL